MNLTIQTLFSDPMIVNAVIDRVLQTRQDRIYWQQYGSFLETKTRVFKTYLGTVTGVMAGSIIGKNDQKPIRERRSLGSGYTEIAYLGDRYQMDIERLSQLQDILDKFNAANTSDQRTILNEIIDFIYDDYRQILLAPHKRMDIVTGELLMTGKAKVHLADNKENIELLDIDLPFKFLKPEVAVRTTFISYLKEQIEALKAKYGVFSKMIMSRGTFNKNIVGSKEFGETFKMILGSNQFYVSGGLITSQMASSVFSGIGLPTIEIKEDYVENQNGENVQIYADDRITLLQSDNVMRMRHHRPYVMTDPVPGRNYSQSEGQMSICNYRDEEGRYMEYTAEWIPEFIAPNKIVNIDLSTMNA
nr:MAG TPA: capsid protein [Bacteriophage sp.]